MGAAHDRPPPGMTAFGISGHSLHGVITGTRICKPTKAFIGIYGEGRRCFAIAIQLEKT
jgi:hypothetical protein